LPPRSTPPNSKRTETLTAKGPRCSQNLSPAVMICRERRSLVAVLVFAYPLSCREKGENREAQEGDSRAGRAALEQDSQRRKNVTDSLKLLDKRQAKKKLSLEGKIAQAGSTGASSSSFSFPASACFYRRVVRHPARQSEPPVLAARAADRRVGAAQLVSVVSQEEASREFHRGLSKRARHHHPRRQGGSSAQRMPQDHRQ
jgi:hypothetical protein